MIKLLQVGAVPLGYTTDMSDSDFLYYRGNCLDTLEMNWRHNHHMEADGFRLLPDVITSNTPPASPLRRSHSCLAFFHEKTQAQTSLAGPDSSTILQGTDAEIEARLNHTHKVRRQGSSNASTTSTAHLPHLSWVLPHPANPSRRPGNHGEEGRRRGREDDEGRERQRVWRHIGGDLRKMADQFQVNKSSVSFKSSAEAAVPTSYLPGVLSRCLAGSLLCLVWWKLYHGSR